MTAGTTASINLDVEIHIPVPWYRCIRSKLTSPHIQSCTPESRDHSCDTMYRTQRSQERRRVWLRVYSLFEKGGTGSTDQEVKEDEEDVIGLYQLHKL